MRSNGAILPIERDLGEAEELAALIALVIDRAAPAGGESVALEIADTGHDIPPEKQHLLFQELARLEPAASRPPGLLNRSEAA